MWAQKSHTEKKGAPDRGLVAVAIDKDKGSQNALKWTTENLLSRGKTVVLVHVNPVDSHHHQHHSDANNRQTSPYRQNLEKITRELFLTFHCYCTRKAIHCFDVILEDADVVRAITEYVSSSGIENLVLGATSRHGFIRFKTSSVSSSVLKGAPDFCTVYIVSKGKVSSVRQASRPAPYTSPLLEQILHLNKEHTISSDMQSVNSLKAERVPVKVHSAHHEDSIKSPFGRGTKYPNGIPGGGDTSESETDISYVSSGRPSSDRSPSSYLYEAVDDVGHPMTHSASAGGYGSVHWESKFSDHHSTSLHEFSTFSHNSNGTSDSHSPHHLPGEHDDVEAEMRRLKLELKQTMDMYSTACKEALTAKQKAMELHRWRADEERKLEDARLAQEAALSIAEKERAKCRAAIEQAEKANRIADLEAQRRVNMEMRAQREAEEMRKNIAGGGMRMEDGRCRKYTIEEIEVATDHFSEARKIGEGGYGPVFKSFLDHTAVAIKVLRPDAAQGRSQFRREVEVLSCIRHPNMVLLLGACPEYGCLVYEYMANGSLEDRLCRRGNTPAIGWHHRFRIAAEIATGLLFLHQTKPEPIVHRDLKPGNVLLDHNFVSKISDVGLARLVPAVAENVTQCRMTSTAGTFCYIDPEYQQTGMLGVKSDLYSLGIVLLQLLTAKPPMGITHLIEDSIANNYFADVLDPAVPDWPKDEALCLAMIGIQCAEMRRKDRPDLGKVVLPELLRIREITDQKSGMWHCGSHVYQEVMNDQTSGLSESSETHSETSSAVTVTTES